MAEHHTSPETAIRAKYEKHGVEPFYRESGASYRNPHEPKLRRVLDVVVRQWKLDLSTVLDLAAGSGEVTLALRELGVREIEGVDPFTFEAYERRTGLRPGRETFEDIAAGAFAGRDYNLIVCSFAMHLVEESRLAGLAQRLSQIGSKLLILTPHKRPVLRADWGWELENEMVMHRIRARLYRSKWR